MTTPKNRWKLVMGAALALGLLFVAAGLVGRLTGAARAAGPPSTDPLQLSMLLVDKNGTPLGGGPHIVNMELHTSNPPVGTAACTFSWSQVKPVLGRYRGALTSCVQQTALTHSDLWLKITVNGVLMGTTRISALPHALEASVASERLCPPGYLTALAAGKTICKRGADEVVRVGAYWVDRYEISVVDAATYEKGRCDGAWTQFGATKDDYTSDFPDSGAWKKRRYACSVGGKTPSRHMTWFQAQQACVAAGKHLCTNAQWQGAAAGTPDTSCNVSGSAMLLTGAMSGCVSKWGAMDMAGNAWEWVAWWDQAGTRWLSTKTDEATPWPKGYGDGADVILGLDGSADDGSGIRQKGLPAAATRGGAHGGGAQAGVYAVSLDRAPTYSGASVGVRC